MYGWLWHRLPGNTLVRALVCLALFLVTVLVLFQWVFPRAEPLLPFGDETVDGGGSSSTAPAAPGTASPTGAASPSGSAGASARPSPSHSGTSLEGLGGGVPVPRSASRSTSPLGGTTL